MTSSSNASTSPVAFITGGGGGLGTVIASVLLEDGFAVAIVDRDAALAEAAARKVNPDGHFDDRVLPVTADITDDDQVQSAVDLVEKRWGRLDALVNNAGIEPPHSLQTVDRSTWQRIQEVNVRAPLTIVQRCVPIWQRQQRGRIVTIGSRTWLAGGETIGYVASKAAVVGLTRSFATELGPIGVTANVVAPSFVRTPLNATKGDPAFVDEFAKRFASLSPLNRLIDPVDVANAVAFLVSERARNITGEVLHVAAGTQMAPMPQ